MARLIARGAGLLALLLTATAPQAAPTFTALDVSGEVITASRAATAQAACVRDAQSGLTWALKNHAGDLHDRRWTYTPYDGNPATNGGYAGYRDGTSGNCPRERMRDGSCNTEAYVEAVNATALCGYRDWRLPTYAELAAIAPYTHGDTTPTPGQVFADTEEGWYWTAVTKVGVTSFSRVVLLPPRARPKFYDGSYLVMVVRGPSVASR